jgi:hypothetical protein
LISFDYGFYVLSTAKVIKIRVCVVFICWLYICHQRMSPLPTSHCKNSMCTLIYFRTELWTLLRSFHFGTSEGYPWACDSIGALSLLFVQFLSRSTPIFQYFWKFHNSKIWDYGSFKTFGSWLYFMLEKMPKNWSSPKFRIMIFLKMGL